MTTTEKIAERPLSFLEELREQRWDDHRYYHQSRVNQSLHLLSALCFLTSYALIPISPIAAAIFGWVIAMWPRQIGHFFFEPRGFDRINRVSFAHKEKVKVGYNLQRKLVLLAIWLAIPVTLHYVPSFFGLVAPSHDRSSYFHNLGVLWLALGAAGLIARTLWLVVIWSPQTGLVWLTKILTDPFHDLLIYGKAPLALLRGEWMDPMLDVQEEVERRS